MNYFTFLVNGHAVFPKKSVQLLSLSTFRQLKFFNPKGELVMEIAKLELAAVEHAVINAPDRQIVELLDLQLALVGGGVGEVILG